jgi:hypothetical protein
MVRVDLASRKIARAEAWLAQVADLLGDDAEAFAADARRADLASFYLLLATQEAIDLAAHWLAEAGWPPADDVGSTFDALVVVGPNGSRVAPTRVGCPTANPVGCPTGVRHPAMAAPPLGAAMSLI